MISVIIPFYNEVSLISRAVESVLANCKKDVEIEILICNDGPLSELQIRTQLSSIANNVTKVLGNRYKKGPGGARNTGLDASVGDVIAFLDADDIWLPWKLDLQLEAVRRGATFIATSYRFETGSPFVRVLSKVSRPIDVFLHRGIGTSTVVITRSLMEWRRFRDLRFAQDIDYWYMLANSSEFRYAAIDDCCVEYSTGGSTKNKWVQLKHFYRVLCINNISKSMRVCVIISYISAGIKNHYLKRWLI